MRKRLSLSFILLAVIFLLVSCNSKNTSSSNNTTNTTNNTINGLSKQLDTDHFTFYSKDQDKGCIKDLSTILEDNCSKISNDLKTTLSSKVIVGIYSDLDTYHKAINMPDAPAWMVARSGLNTIELVNPSKINYPDFKRTVIHELTHVVEFNINSDMKNIPLWLLEGLAQVEAGQTDGMDQFLKDIKSSNSFISLADLETTDTVKFGEIKGYQYSYLIVKYIIETYGADKVTALINNPSDFGKALDVSKKKFEKDWMDYLQK